MERSHLQPQVVFKRTAKIEGESQTLLKAKLLFTAVPVLYTSMSAGTQGEGEREKGDTQREDGKQREEEWEFREEEEEGRGGQYLHPS